MRYGSICSGIEAATVAWAALGWQAAWFSEIEKFPCAVLGHHYPSVPNFGDMTTLPNLLSAGLVEAPDILCGGTPCQAFSVAGLRKSLDDARGNLSLTFCEIANAIDDARDTPAIIFWENVPGVLNTQDNAFGCFLAGLAGEDAPLEPPGGKWANAGCVLGPRRTVAWRTLDAQWFGLAQRRRRVFVVASARTDFDPLSVLLEFNGVRRDLAPSREAGEGVAPTVMAGAKDGGAGHGARSGPSKDGLIVPHVVGTLDARTNGGGFPGSDGAANGRVLAFGGNRTSGAIDVAAAVNAHGGTGRNDFESETFVTHALRGEGFDASEDGTGRGTPLVPCVYDTTQITSAANRSRPEPGDPSHPLAAGAHPPLLAFHHNAQVDQMKFDPHTSSSSSLTCSQQAAVAFQPRIARNGRGDMGDLVNALQAQSGADGRSDAAPHVSTNMQVRRLTPRECERLQGFPPVAERLILTICTDLQNRNVRVGLQCLRWQCSVSPADGNELTPYVPTAALGSNTSQVGPAPLAVLHVLPLSEGDQAVLRSHARSASLANGVNGYDWFHQVQVDSDSVPSLAKALRTLALETRAGRAASPQSMTLSMPALNGKGRAPTSGAETAGGAVSAVSGQPEATFTTSELGQLTPTFDSPEATSCCSALGAIAGFIPDKTLPACFSLEMTVVTPYTLIPHRGKPAADGPRYKALGNSWAVPVVRWIGQRIATQLTTP